MEKTQPIQNSQYSPYLRGVATGALAAAGTLAAGAFAINSYVHSGAQIIVPNSSTLKEISVSFAGGVLNFFATVPTCLTIHSLAGIKKGSIWTIALAVIVSGTLGCATSGTAHFVERLL